MAEEPIAASAMDRGPSISSGRNANRIARPAFLYVAGKRGRTQIRMEQLDGIRKLSAAADVTSYSGTPGAFPRPKPNNPR